MELQPTDTVIRAVASIDPAVEINRANRQLLRPYREARDSLREGVVCAEEKPCTTCYGLPRVD